MSYFPKNCPFCEATLTTEAYQSHVWRGCLNKICEFHGQPRYQMTWIVGADKLDDETFMIDKYHVKIDYQNNLTRISTLDVIILLGTFELPIALDVNLKNYDETLTKIKTIITFS